MSNPAATTGQSKIDQLRERKRKNKADERQKVKEKLKRLDDLERRLGGKEREKDLGAEGSEGEEEAARTLKKPALRSPGGLSNVFGTTFHNPYSADAPYDSAQPQFAPSCFPTPANPYNVHASARMPQLNPAQLPPRNPNLAFPQPSHLDVVKPGSNVTGMFSDRDCPGTSAMPRNLTTPCPSAPSFPGMGQPPCCGNCVQCQLLNY